MNTSEVIETKYKWLILDHEVERTQGKRLGRRDVAWLLLLSVIPHLLAPIASPPSNETQVTNA